MRNVAQIIQNQWCSVLSVSLAICCISTLVIWHLRQPLDHCKLCSCCVHCSSPDFRCSFSGCTCESQSVCPADFQIDAVEDWRCCCYFCRSKEYLKVEKCIIIWGKGSFTDTGSFVNDTEDTAWASMFLTRSNQNCSSLTAPHHLRWLQFFIQNIFSSCVDWLFQRLWTFSMFSSCYLACSSGFLPPTQGHADPAPLRICTLKISTC